MSFDNCCKLLAEKYPEQFATWLLGQPTASVKVLKTELSIEPIYVQLMAGLRFSKKLIYRVFQEDMMRESVIYQDILQKGEQKGRQEGKQEGELALILRQLTRQIRTIAPEAEAQVRSLSLSQLDKLGEALLDFSQPSDLEDWLRLQ